MKTKIKLIALVFCISLSMPHVYAVTKTVGGAGANYSTLKLAFDAINAGSVTGAIILQITGTTTENATASLNASGSGSANYSSITIYPTTTGLSIKGNLATALIKLNGADNVSIDGRLNASGITKSLTISNTSTSTGAGTSTIQFIGSAENNNIKYCFVKGSEKNASSGIIFFSTANAGNGNDGNTFDNNDICSDAAGRCFNAIFSLGTQSRDNSGNTFSNNNIYNFWNTGSSSYAFLLTENTSAFTITGNSFYETSSLVPTGGVIYQIIRIYASGTAGNNFTISNNYFGGSAPLCGGGPLSLGLTGNIQEATLDLIRIGAGTTIASSIQGNIFKNISFRSSHTEPFRGIFAVSGIINIGTTAGNTFGSLTGTGSILLSSGTATAFSVGIYVNSINSLVISNNLFGSITTASSNSAYAHSFYGIYKPNVDGDLTINNDTIGSSIEPNSIRTSSLSTRNAQSLYGIYSLGTGNITINQSSISNLTNATTNTNDGTKGVVNGISAINSTNTITSNTIHDLTIANANNSSTNTASVCGIALNSTGLKTLSDNTIFNLSNSYSSFAGNIIGLYYTAGTGANVVLRNFIHSLSVTGASSTTASMYGIKMASGATTYSNNIISIGGNSATSIYGIYETGAGGNNNNLYFNTICVSGSLASGAANKSYALYSAETTNSRNFRNNIFANFRSTVGGSKLHTALYISSTGGTLTVNYNDYYSSGTGALLGYYGAEKAALPIVTSQDVNSMVSDPVFGSNNSTEAADYQPGGSVLTAVTGTGITNDYDLITRSISNPIMGAWEYYVSPVEIWGGVNPVFKASYLTLKAAFDAINAGTWKGSLIIKIKGNTTELATAVLNASGNPSDYSSILIYPTRLGIMITGNLAAPLVDLNGCDNVTIDGRKDATGAISGLTFLNTSTSAAAGTSTFRFINSAGNNIIKYCTIKGSETSATSGIIFFSTSSSKPGNNSNIIDNNNITSATDANRPTNAIYAFGTSGKENSANTISNNKIYNFLNKVLVSYGIQLADNNDSWTISGNSFYETASFVATNSIEYSVININNVSGNGFAISGNYIGGNAALCGGTAFTKTNATDNSFTAIKMNVGTGSGNSVQNNTIKNISWSNSGTASWTGINIFAGNVNVGTTLGNTLGATTGTGSITVTSASTGANVYGIYLATTGTVDCQNNKIGAITVGNGSSNATNFYGIYKIAVAGTTTISYNTIGSTVTANSILASSTSTGSAQSIYGIYNSGSGAITINNNIIANLKNATSNSTNATVGLINGITSVDGTNTINFNTIRNLTIANNNNSSINTASVAGIVLMGATTRTVTGNTIYSLSNTNNNSFSGSVIGLYFSAGTSSNVVSRNFINTLTVTGSSSTTASIYGIKVASGATTYSNNIISLGGNTKTTIYGIYETGVSGNNNSLYFNTVYIGGILPKNGSNYSYAFYTAVNTNTRNFRNNIFMNARSRTNGSSNHYAIYYASTGGSLTVNYNDYFVSGTGGVLAYYNGSDRTTLVLLKTATSQDANSLNINPAFLSAGSAIASDYSVTVTSLVAVDGTGITIDYASNGRGGSSTMGAWEQKVNKWKGTTSTNWNTSTNWTGNIVPAVDANIVFDDAPANNCQMDQNRSVNHIVNASNKTLITNGYILTVKGNFSFTNEAKINASATNSTVEFSGAASQSIPIGTFVNNEVYNLTVNNESNVVLSGTLRLLNDLTTISGQLDVTTDSPTTVVYAGTDAQTIGSGLYFNDSLNNLTIDNAAGVTLSNCTRTIVSADLTILSGKKFIIAPAKQLTVQGITSCTEIAGLLIQSDSTGTGSIIEYNSGVLGTVQRFVPTNNKYHYVSPPVKAAKSGVFHYAWLYEWKEPTQTWFNIVPTSYQLVPLKGYSVLLHNVSGNPGIEPNNPVIYTGELNCGEQGSNNNISFSTSNPNTTLRGYNLVGNPYPSAINWDAPTGWTKTNVNDAIYFWDGRTSQYSSYVNKTGNNGGSNFIPAQQGFFVRANGVTGTLKMNNSVRCHDSASSLRSDVPENILRFKLENDLKSDETVIKFTQDATANFDGNYDAYKLFGYIQRPQLFTHTADSLFASINSLPQLEIDSTKVLMSIRVGVSGDYKITVNGIESFVNPIYLAIEDTKTKTTQILTDNPVYSFHADSSAIDDRFILWFYKKAVSIAPTTHNEVNVFSNHKTISVDLRGIISTDAEITISNMLGQVLDKKEIISNQVTSFKSDLPTGYYIVRVLAGQKCIEKKLYLD